MFSFFEWAPGSDIYNGNNNNIFVIMLRIPRGRSVECKFTLKTTTRPRKGEEDDFWPVVLFVIERNIVRGERGRAKFNSCSRRTAINQNSIYSATV